MTTSETTTAYKQKSLENVITTPRITEKAAKGTTENVYTFNVALDANKIEIKKAVQALYNVRPEKVRIVRMRPVSKMTRGRVGTAKAYKKAMVYLKKGDTIEF